jgi:hypothetical protein
MPDTFNILLDKLDRFIRRYYLNQLIKGSLFFGAGLLILFLLFITIEYFGYLSTNIRFVLFYGFLVFNLFVLVRYVFLPILGMMKIGRKISEEQAAHIIGKHYRNELNDKITNVLQLKKYLAHNPENAALIMAGIDQKASIINPIPFQNAIPLKGNLRFVPYFVIPVLFITFFYFLQPTFIIEPVTRIVQYETHFERPTPFTFHIQSELNAFKNEDIEIVAEVKGSILPAVANIKVNSATFRMTQRETGVHRYTLRNLQSDTEFYIEAQGYVFGPFLVNVFEKPSFNHFQISVEHPEYTGLSDETFTNMGDLSVIHGSTIHYTFYTNTNSEIKFLKADDELDANTERDGLHTLSAVADNSFEYKVYAYNETHGFGDSLTYYVNVQRDAFPRIAVEEHRDDVLLAHLFYRGTVEDDFGFTGLFFNYRVMDQFQVRRGADLPFMKESVDFEPIIRNQSFIHYFDLQSIYVQPGETVEIYFEVYDNDEINGPKSSRSQLFTYYIPSEDEILAERRETEEKIEEVLSDGMGEVQNAKDQIEELRKQLLDSDRVGWEQREVLQELIEKKDEMEQSLQEMSEMKKESDTRSEQFMENSERIKEKQEELQDLFDEVLTDELKELFDKIREELDNLSRDDVYEMLDQMEFEFDDLENQMDRALEMFRQFAMEQILEESINRLEKLAEEQEELKEETSANGDSGDLSEEQKEISDSFEQVKDMLEEFRDLNEKLQRPQPIDDTSESEQDISEDIQNALEQLQQDSQQNAVPFQQDAGQKMKKLSNSLQEMQENLFQEQLAEDARTIRMILENLLRTSFSQEELLTETRQANVNDPRFLEMMREQRKIQSDLQMIQDSLTALSKRQMAIQSFVNREIAEIQMQMEYGIDNMVNRRRHQASSRQQLVMTHINNLALLLNESLQDMQQQMAMGDGMGEDSQPGEGGTSFQDLRQMQEQLNEMLQQMQNGQQPMPGETGEGGMSLSEQMARMAAEQEAIRNELKGLTDEMRNDGMEVGEDLDQLQRDMERSELDMLRKQLSRQTIMRQEQILTRLLEHERAELQREQDDRREGTTAKDYEISNPDEFFEYNRIREREVEMLRSLPPGLRPFYRSYVEKYFLQMQ